MNRIKVLGMISLICSSLLFVKVTGASLRAPDIDSNKDINSEYVYSSNSLLNNEKGNIMSIRRFAELRMNKKTGESIVLSTSNVINSGLLKFNNENFSLMYSQGFFGKTDYSEPILRWQGVVSQGGTSYVKDSVVWVKVNSPFDIGVDYYMTGSSGLYPNVAQIKLYDDTEAETVLSYNGGVNLTSKDSLSISNSNQYKSNNEKLNYNALNTRLTLTPNKHGKSYKIFSRSSNKDNITDWDDTGQVIKTDGKAPIVKILNENKNKWISASSYELKFSVTDEDSGVGSKKIKTSGAQSSGGWKDVSNKNSITINTQGETEIILSGTDNVTNYSEKKTVVRLDSVNPNINIDGNLTDEAVVVTLDINVSDAPNGSGIDYVILPDGSKKTINDDNRFNNNISYDVEENGEYTFEVYDNAGNKSVRSIEVNNIIPRDSRIHLDVGNFYKYEYVDPNDSKTYWVKVGDPFNFDVNSATLKPSNISPTENRIDMWDGSTLRHLTGQDKNGSQTYYTNSGFDSDFKVDSVTHKRPTMTNYNWLITYFSIIPLHHGKTYEGWFTGGYNSSFVSEKYTGQKIKTDGKAPVTAFGTHYPYTWLSQDSFTLTTSVSDPDSGVKYFRYFTSGAQAMPDWTWGTPNMNIVINQQGRTNVSIVGMDNVGNSVQLNTYVLLDNIKPDISISSNPTSWTNNNVTLSVRCTDNSNGSGIDYIVFPDGSRKNMGNDVFNTTESYTVSNNGTYKFTVYDKAGNSKSTSINVTNIDKSAPWGDAWIENVSQDGFDVVVSSMGDDKSGVNRVEICAWRDGWDVDGRWQTQYTSGGAVRFRVNISDYANKAGNYYADIRVYDNAGNGGNVLKHLSIWIPYPNIYSEPINLTDYEYHSNGVYWVQSGNPFTAKVFGHVNPYTGRYKINSEFLLARAENATNFNNFKAFEAVIPDWVGNWTAHNDFKLSTNTFNTSLNAGPGYSMRTDWSWVDTFFNVTLSGDENIKLSPIVRINADGRVMDSDWYASSVVVRSDSQGPTIKLTSNSEKDWNNKNITVSINVTDSRSGVRNWTVKRRVNNGSWINLNDKTTSIVLTEDGTHQIEVVAVDNVGNTSSKSITIRVDKTAPEKFTFNPYEQYWVNRDIPVNWSATDATSGIDSYSYKVTTVKNGVTSTTVDWTTFSSTATSYTISAEGESTIQVKVKDKAGNEKIFTSGIYKLDKTIPSGLTFNPNSKDWTNVNIPVSWSGTDALSGVASYSYKVTTVKNGVTSTTVDWTEFNLSNTSYIVSVESESTIHVKVKDKAGNVNTFTSGLYQYDITFPEIWNIPVNNSSYIDYKEIVIDATDQGGSQMKKLSLYRNGTLVTSGVDSIYYYESVNGTHTYRIVAEDHAGNITEKIFTITITPDDIDLIAIEKPDRNLIRLEWSHKILANKSYTVYQKNEYQNSFSIVPGTGESLTNRYLDNTYASDITAPTMPSGTYVSETDTHIRFKITPSTDIGTNYDFYVVSKDNHGKLTQSNIANETITTGVKGYTYVIDTNPNTIPDNTVDTPHNVLTIDAPILNGQKHYLHIAAIDNAGNMSAVYHTLLWDGVEDNWLNQEIANQLGKDLDDIRISDYAEIEYISLRRKGISGEVPKDIKKAINIEEIDLYQNNITDISNLAGLENLEYLQLANNNITDISALEGLNSLTFLNLYNNQISDISIISEMKKLEMLFLHKNNITDITPIADLPNLFELYVEYNYIDVNDPTTAAILDKYENNGCYVVKLPQNRVTSDYPEGIEMTIGEEIKPNIYMGLSEDMLSISNKRAILEPIQYTLVSSNEDVIKIIDNKLVALSEGTASVTIQYYEYKNINTQTIKVTVKNINTSEDIETENVENLDQENSNELESSLPDSKEDNSDLEIDDNEKKDDNSDLEIDDNVLIDKEDNHILDNEGIIDSNLNKNENEDNKDTSDSDLDDKKDDLAEAKKEPK